MNDGFSPYGNQPAQNPYLSSPNAGFDQPLPGSELPLASRGSRLGAAMLDGILQLLLFIPSIVCFVVGALMNESDPDTGTIFIVIGVGLLLLAFLVVLVVQLYMLATRSQTIGKYFMKVQIHDVEKGGRADWVKSIVLRAIVNGLIGSVPYVGALYSLVDMLFIFREDRRCIHDLLAGTRVVDIS